MKKIVAFCIALLCLTIAAKADHIAGGEIFTLILQIIMHSAKVRRLCCDVCVEEIRNGVVIVKQCKDLQINIAPCNVAAAILEPEYMLCKSTKTISLANISISPLIRTYHWELTNRSDAVVFTSTDLTVTYTFTDTGLYKIKLSINRGESCKDSTVSTARVYPNFVPDFNFAGICFNKPTVFKDATTTANGIVNQWSRAFGIGRYRTPPILTHQQAITMTDVR